MKRTLGYVIVRQDGAYVAPAGQESSYTLELNGARVFATREAADRERCVENEDTLPLLDDNGRLYVPYH